MNQDAIYNAVKSIQEHRIYFTEKIIPHLTDIGEVGITKIITLAIYRHSRYVNIVLKSSLYSALRYFIYNENYITSSDIKDILECYALFKYQQWIGNFPIADKNKLKIESIFYNQDDFVDHFLQQFHYLSSMVFNFDKNIYMLPISLRNSVCSSVYDKNSKEFYKRALCAIFTEDIVLDELYFKPNFEVHAYDKNVSLPILKNLYQESTQKIYNQILKIT